jgi:hypothetical protein
MDDVLLPGEKVLESQPANLLVGLDLDTAPHPPGVLGALLTTAKGVAQAIQGEAVAGTLWLTSHRFYFASRGMSWTRGSYSIFLSTILDQKETDGLLSDQLTVRSRANVHRFVVRNAHGFVDALADARSQSPSVATLKEQILAELDKVGSGLAAKWPGPHPSEDMIHLVEQSVEAKETDAIQALAVISALELFVAA